MPDLQQRRPRAERADLPEHVTTPLLTLITSRSMDEDYAHVAARRGRTGTPRPTSARARWATVLTVGLFGLLAAVVGVQTSRDAEVEELGRSALISQITSRRAELGDLQEQVSTLTRGNQAVTSRINALTQQQADMRGTVSRLEVSTGHSPVRGEGVRITLDNRPGVDVNSEIRDEDLAVLVDGLWAAGAEAVAIDDERITVLGGIRNTNRAVHVNGNPVTAPYVVSAIGDTATLQARFQESSEGQEFLTRVNTFGFLFGIDNVDDVRLPAAPLRSLRYVEESSTEPAGTSGGEGDAP